MLTLTQLWVYNIISASQQPWTDHLIICTRARWSGLPRPSVLFTRFTGLSIYHTVLLRIGSDFSLSGLRFHVMAQHWVSLGDTSYVRAALVLAATLAKLWEQNLVGHLYASFVFFPFLFLFFCGEGIVFIGTVPMG